MTVRGFLACYLGIVAMVSASGATMWRDIQLRKHPATATVVAAPIIQATNLPSPIATAPDMASASAAEEPIEAAPPKVVSRPSETASPPAPRGNPPAVHATRVTSSATRPAAHLVRTVKSVPHVPRYPGPAYVAPYPRYASGYVAPYSPVVMAPWGMQAYPRYYPYRQYYPRYPYYPAY
jgi:hypothetical protein